MERQIENHGQIVSEIGNHHDPSSTSGERQALIDGLNHDLAAEYQAILMHMHYAAKLSGPFRRDLRALFEAELPDEQAHARFLAEKITGLGGEPTTEPRAVPRANETREMLEHALCLEREAIAACGMRIRQAEALEDVALKRHLESQVAGRRHHMEEIERILASWK